MAIIALDVQKNYMVLQKSALEYRSMVCNSQKMTVASNLGNIANAHSKDTSFDMATDTDCQALQAVQQSLDAESGSIETQLKAIREAIKGFQDVIKENIKSECKLNISA